MGRASCARACDVSGLDEPTLLTATRSAGTEWASERIVARVGLAWPLQNPLRLPLTLRHSGAHSRASSARGSALPRRAWTPPQGALPGMRPTLGSPRGGRQHAALAILIAGSCHRELPLASSPALPARATATRGAQALATPAGRRGARGAGDGVVRVVDRRAAAARVAGATPTVASDWAEVDPRGASVPGARWKGGLAGIPTCCPWLCGAS